MAYVEAISNGGSGTTAARANACRSGYFAQNRVVVSINGAQRAGTIKASIRIRERIGKEPPTADLELKGGAGFVPDRGQAVTIGHGTIDNRLFHGRIVRASRMVARHVEKKPTYALEAADLLMDLARAVPATGLYTQSLSAASIVRGLLSAATPSATSMGFAATYIQSDMPIVAEFLVGPHESVVAAFDRLAEAVGATWYSDVRQRIHFYTSSDPETKPTIGTLTGTSPGYLSLTRHTEFSRVFSRVVGVGAATETTHDVWSDDTRVPVRAFEPIIDTYENIDGVDYRNSSTGRILMQQPRSVFSAYLNNAVPRASLFGTNPASTTGNYWVGDLAWYDPGLGQILMNDRAWWSVDGAQFRVESYSTFSTSANTAYVHFITPITGAGAPPPTATGVIPDGTPVTAENYELILDDNDFGFTGVTPRRVIPSGTPVRVYYEVASSTINNAIQSLAGSVVYGTATDTLDASLRPAELIEACEARLGEGHPDNWTTFELTTRDPLVQRGQRVYLSVTGPGESSGPSYTGAYTVQEVEIGGFDETAESKGPIRTVTLGGSIQKPTLFDTLDTWNV